MPYRTPAARVESLPPKRHGMRSWLRFQFGPPLLTRCPYCESRMCPHANFLSFTVWISFCFVWGQILVYCIHKSWSLIP